jgi:hypothetical protein
MLFGAKIAASVVVSPIIGMPELDLIHMGKEVYTGAAPRFKTFFVTRHVGGGPSTVTYAPIRLLAGSFLGPGSILLPGCTVEGGSAVSERTLVAPGVTVKAGFALLGTRGSRIHYRPVS